jgi:hypothetical protein
MHTRATVPLATLCALNCSQLDVMCMHTHHTLLHPYCYPTVPSLRGPALIVSI